LLPDEFICSIRAINLSSTNGPLRLDLLIQILFPVKSAEHFHRFSLPRRRWRMIC
jgi:hypothetical protein